MSRRRNSARSFLRKDCAFYSPPLNRSVSILHFTLRLHHTQSSKIDIELFTKINYEIKSKYEIVIGNIQIYIFSQNKPHFLKMNIFKITLTVNYIHILYHLTIALYHLTFVSFNYTTFVIIYLFLIRE